MEMTEGHYFYALTSKIRNKGSKLTHHTVNLLKMFLMFPKNPLFQYIHVICSMKEEIWKSLVMLTTKPHLGALKNQSTS